MDLAPQGPPQGSTEDRRAIAILQDARSNVADKLNSLDCLASKPPETLRGDLDLALPEPLAQTIFDLTQHSDAEVAGKAKALANRVDIDGYVVEGLSSKDMKRRTAAEGVLLRISSKHAQALLKRVDVGRYDDLRKFAADVAAGTKTRS
jgi:hypothetical protein